MRIRAASKRSFSRACSFKAAALYAIEVPSALVQDTVVSWSDLLEEPHRMIYGPYRGRRVEPSCSESREGR